MKQLFSVLFLLIFSYSISSDVFAGTTTEGFEGGFPPTGWTTINTGYPTSAWVRATTFPYAGSAVAQIVYGPAATLNLDWLITPRFGSIGAGDSLVFYASRYWQGANLTWDTTFIMVSTTTADTNSFTKVFTMGLKATDSASSNYPPRSPIGGTGAAIYKRYAVSLAAYAGQNIYIAFRHLDVDGTGLKLDEVTIPGLVTSVGNNSETPVSYGLKQNYPNPFNPSTTIAFSIPEQQHVMLKVYDLLGRQVASLIDAVKPAGNYEVNFNASSLPSGFYVYRLEAGEFIETRKMQLVK